MKVDDILKYDYLKIKPYDMRIQDEIEGKSYILSFSDEHHVKVSETVKVIIDLFDGQHSLLDIKEEIQRKGIVANENDLQKLVQEVLIDKGMLEGTQFENKKGNEMLWIKIPLLDSWKLNKLFSLLKVVFDKYMLIIGILGVLTCTTISLYMVLNMEKEFPFNSILIMIIGYISLIIHEFGHASAAYKYKINVGKIGIGMYFLYPVMYIDMTSAWRLPSKQRVMIDFGGMYFQALTTIPLTIVGLVSRNPSFFVCSVYILAMSIYNLMPFLKLDGYWLFCDYFELNNLSHNAFKVIKNQIINRGNKLTKKKKMYYIFSLVYTISIIFMFCVGIVYSITTIRNWDYIEQNSKVIVSSFCNGEIQAMFGAINSILIYLLPVIFMSVMIVKSGMRFFLNRKRNK